MSSFYFSPCSTLSNYRRWSCASTAQLSRPRTSRLGARQVQRPQVLQRPHTPGSLTPREAQVSQGWTEPRSSRTKIWPTRPCRKCSLMAVPSTRARRAISCVGCTRRVRAQLSTLPPPHRYISHLSRRSGFSLCSRAGGALRWTASAGVQVCFFRCGGRRSVVATSPSCNKSRGSWLASQALKCRLSSDTS